MEITMASRNGTKRGKKTASTKPHFPTPNSFAPIGDPGCDNPYNYVSDGIFAHKKKSMDALRKAMKHLDIACKAVNDARVYASEHRALVPEYHASSLLATAIDHVVYNVRHEVNRYLQIARPEPDINKSEPANNI
jgi:hypothetical protein